MKAYTPLTLPQDEPALNLPANPPSTLSVPANNTDGRMLDNVEQEDEFREWLEVEILKAIHELYKSQDTPHDRIRFLANKALELIVPGMAIEELFNNAIKLNEDCPEFNPLVNELIKQYEQKYNKKAIEQVTKLVEDGSIEEAQEVMKKVLQFKMT